MSKWGTKRVKFWFPPGTVDPETIEESYYNPEIVVSTDGTIAVFEVGGNMDGLNAVGDICRELEDYSSAMEFAVAVTFEPEDNDGE